MHITATLLLPVKEFFKIRVNLDDLNGIKRSESLKANSDMTFPRADSEVLINLASFNRRSLYYFINIRRISFLYSLRTC